jgi:hypothetical protein
MGSIWRESVCKTRLTILVALNCNSILARGRLNAIGPQSKMWRAALF